VNITGVESILYGCRDIATAQRFFTDLGFAVDERSTDQTSFRLPDNSTVILRSVDDLSLPAAPVEGDTAREVIWGVDNASTLASISTELSRDRDVAESGDGVLHSIDDSGHAIGFRVSQRQSLSLELPLTNTPGNRLRRNRRAVGTEIRVPAIQRFAHVGYWASGDVDENMAFWVERLGFRVSEYIKNVGVFLRAAGSNEHHDVFFARRRDRRGFQHASYEVRDFDEVMLLGGHMEEQGWESHFGPGRHIFGSNIFWYFWHPAGALLEITADLDYIDDGWETIYHEALPKGAGSWLVRRGDLKRIPFRTREEDAIIE
jgi:catechol 2,3-dioxygenase-like lactoylglutathione lyase family enzyme